MTIDIESLQNVQKTLHNYPNSELLIVTKNREEKDILRLINLGFNKFGENRVQEASKKFNKIINEYLHHIDLHLIGPLQSNKVKQALEIFDTIQSIDRKKIIDVIANEKLKINKNKNHSFFLQVNIGEEIQKFGAHPKELKSLYNYALSKDLNIKGLMCIPPNDSNSKYFFGLMKTLRDQINPNLKLSMGMSADYEVALNCGSNFIRVGSKIFL